MLWCEGGVLMCNIIVDNIIDVVVKLFGDDIFDCNWEIMVSVFKYMYDFCKDVNLIYDEWFEVMVWFCWVGDIIDSVRSEFILICDILGVEVLVDMLDKKVIDGEIILIVLGLFYCDNLFVLFNGVSII